eukprot:38583-Eustigmatos_ZCMA.PRE.1
MSRFSESTTPASAFPEAHRLPSMSVRKASCSHMDFNVRRARHSPRSFVAATFAASAAAACWTRPLKPLLE